MEILFEGTLLPLLYFSSLACCCPGILWAKPLCYFTATVTCAGPSPFLCVLLAGSRQVLRENAVLQQRLESLESSDQHRSASVRAVREEAQKQLQEETRRRRNAERGIQELWRLLDPENEGMGGGGGSNSAFSRLSSFSTVSLEHDLTEAEFQRLQERLAGRVTQVFEGNRVFDEGARALYEQVESFAESVPPWETNSTFFVTPARCVCKWKRSVVGLYVVPLSPRRAFQKTSFLAKKLESVQEDVSEHLHFRSRRMHAAKSRRVQELELEVRCVGE